MTTLVLADDHAAFAEALATVLVDHGLEVVATVHTVTDLVVAARGRPPEVFLLDRWFDGADVLTVLPELRACAGRARVVLLTADPDQGLPALALAHGAHGYVHKTRGIAALLDSLEVVAAGATAVEVPPRWTSRPGRGSSCHPRVRLTSRERQCLALLVQGASTAQIATRLEVGGTTVRTHVQTLMMKLGVHTRLEAAAYAVRCGLVDDVDSTAECQA